MLHIKLYEIGYHVFLKISFIALTFLQLYTYYYLNQV